MKKILATISALVLIASVANAQSGLGGLLGSIFGGNKTENTEATTSGTDIAGTAESVLGALLGTVISQVVPVSLPGTWTYNGVAFIFHTPHAQGLTIHHGFIFLSETV